MKAKWWIIGLSIALLLAVISPLASAFPDGLEKAAEELGFIDRTSEPAFSVMPDYALPSIKDKAAATILASTLGTLILFGLGFGIARILKKKRHEA